MRLQRDKYINIAASVLGGGGIGSILSIFSNGARARVAVIVISLTFILAFVGTLMLDLYRDCRHRDLQAAHEERRKSRKVNETAAEEAKIRKYAPSYGSTQA